MMVRNMRKRKLKKWVIPTFTSILVITIAIPTAYGFYFADSSSSILTNFIVNSNLKNAYVRATVLTYWVDSKTCNGDDLTSCTITAKKAWTIKSDAYNSSWQALSDGYYYYKGTIDGSVINKDNIKTHEIALLDSSLSIDELSDEELTITDIVPTYEVVYEFIEGSDEALQNSWKVTYQDGAFQLIE